jgi:predicted O-methyltransferase YrrM
MYNHFEIASKYAKYLVKASNGKGHGIHSPFIYQFIEQVLNAPTQPITKTVEQLRTQLLNNNTTITVADFGAGSTTGATQNRTIKSIAKHAAKPKKYAKVLYEIVKHFGCVNIIELGTSLGISTAYMATANPLCTVTTCEGSSTIAQIAKDNFQRLYLNNIHQLVGEFSITLPQALALHASIDLLFVDGNHQYQPTIDYFESALPKLHNNSIVVFDDIHWSKEMENAWKKIKAHPQVSESIDLFFLGIVFFRKEQLEKQHFTIRY